MAAVSIVEAADLAIIRELFKNTIKGAKTLGIDSDYQQQLQAALDRLRPYHIGKRGNLMEWYHDWDDQDWHHRHQSHLLGLYPFHQISVAKTPELAAAATKTLEIKGDNSTGWSTGWRINLWARLHRADKASRYTANCSPTLVLRFTRIASITVAVPIPTSSMPIHHFR